MIQFFYDDMGALSCRIGQQTYYQILCKKALPLDLNVFENIGIYDTHHNEIYWLNNLEEINPDESQWIIQSLKMQFVFKKIEKIIHVSTVYFPNIWEVVADGENHTFEIDSSENFFDYTKHGILIRDVNNLFYLLPPFDHLDIQSQKKLLPFL